MRKLLAGVLVGLWGLFTVAVFIITRPNETVSDYACLAGDAGEVCADLQEQLQLAVARDATNMYKVKKAFSTPSPAVVNVIYDVIYTVPCNRAHYCKDDIENATTAECHQVASRLCVSDYSGTYNFMWTDRAIYTIYSPALLRQLQIVILFRLIERTTRSPVVHSAVSSEMDTLMWDGCDPAEIATITLTLNITASSVIPTHDQLNTSLQELTTWLRAFTDVPIRFGETLPNLDTDKKHFAILPKPPSKFPSKDWELTHQILSFVVTLLVCLFMGESSIIGWKIGWKNIKRIFPERTHKRVYQWAFWPPAFVLLVWNIQVVCVEIHSLYTQCSPSDIDPAAYKLAMLIFTFVYMIPRALMADKPKVPPPEFLGQNSHPLQRRQLHGDRHPQQRLHSNTHPKPLPTTIFIRFTASLAVWNIVAIVQYATVGVVMGVLLMTAYSTQVFTAAVTIIAIPFSCINLSFMLYIMKFHNSSQEEIDRWTATVSFFVYVLGAIFILVSVELSLSVLEAIILDVASTIGGVSEFGVTALPSVLLGLITWMINYLFSATITANENTPKVNHFSQ